MKKTVISIFLTAGLLSAYTQQTNYEFDISPDSKNNSVIPVSDYDPPLDTLFKYPLPGSISLTSIETDGNHYFMGNWMEKEFASFDTAGNLLNTFVLNYAPGFSDLAYDGQYYYGGRSLGTSFFTLDLANELIIDSINLPFPVKAVAYNHDLDVFYGSKWSEDIKVFKADGTIIDTIPLNGQYGNYIGFAYDGWTEGGPFLWGFSQDVSGVLLVQMELPSGNETGLYIDLSEHWQIYGWAGGLFTHQDPVTGQVVLGGLVQNNCFFGLELLDITSPPTDSLFAVNYHHASLVDSFDVQLSWSPARYSLINEYFENFIFPPTGWTKETYNGDGMGWDNMIPNYVYWPVPETDSRFAIAYEDMMSFQRCCDYLITPEIELNSQHTYFLSFESYYDGSNNHSAYVKYTMDNGQNWTLLHTMVPEPGGWVKMQIPLTSIPADQAFKIAFHSDDNWGDGSGWAIDNAMVYTNDIPVNVLGYDVYRDGDKINNSLIGDTTFIDTGAGSGNHEYYISAVYQLVSMNSGKINIRVPHYPPPPPSPDCNPPLNLQAAASGNEIGLSWSPPVAGITKSNAWDVQFIHPLHQDDEAGLTCDGMYFYTTYLENNDFAQYDLQGNYLYNAPGFTPGARNLEYITLTGETAVTFGRYFGTEIITLPGGQHQSNFPSPPGNDWAIAYNPDLDAFYINDRSSDILLVDRQTGNVLSSFICRTHGNYYDFAYDNWSAGGPYLWGFSADGINGCSIVQISLPDGLETGFTYDASWMSTSGNPKPGGLFIMEGLVPGSVSLCGLIQGEVMFGLELGPAEWDFFVGGYNVYMDDLLHNNALVNDTTYQLAGLDPGTYNFEVSAVYQDSLGNFLCESVKEGPATATIVGDDSFLIGGNIISGAYKLDAGQVELFSFSGAIPEKVSGTEVDELGYYLFPDMYEDDYLMYARPSGISAFASTHVPTYLGGSIHWEDAGAVYINDDSFNNDIYLQELAEPGTGEGSISGMVFEQSTDGEAMLPNVLVLLLNTQGVCVKMDYSNNAGEFSFLELPLTAYKLLVEITGKAMEPVFISLTSSEPDKNGINMIVMETEVVMGMDEEFPGWIDMISEIYPNPAGHEAGINISLRQNAALTMGIFNATGHMLQMNSMVLDKGSNIIKIDTEAFSPGIYYINFEFESGYRFTRKLIVTR